MGDRTRYTLVVIDEDDNVYSDTGMFNETPERKERNKRVKCLQNSLANNILSTM